MRLEVADSAVEDVAVPVQRSWPWYVAATVGGVGLTGAALMDGIAVLGRHVGFGFLGSIERYAYAVPIAPAQPAPAAAAEEAAPQPEAGDPPAAPEEPPAEQPVQTTRVDDHATNAQVTFATAR